MAKKVFTDESLETLIDETKSYVDSAVSKKANSSHTHSISNITNLQSTLDGKVPTSRTVNGKALSSNITLSASDVGAAASSHSHSSYVNQNAFSNVKVGDTTISADTTTDTLNLVAGSNVTITPDATNDKITISAKDTTYNLGSFGITATASELNKLDGVTATTAELNYVDGVTSNIQTQLNDKAPIANGQYAVTTAGTGAAYTATVPSIKSLTAGVSFIMIPNTVSTTTAPTLNVNSLGAKSIKRRLSNLPTSLQNGYSNAWLAKGKPFRVVYDGTAWIVEGHEKPSAADLYGLTATITELNYCDGVTSSIQTQLNALSSRIATLETILANDVLAINV